MLYKSMLFLASELIDGIKNLVYAEGLVLDNISMDEGDEKKSGNFLSAISQHNQAYNAENLNVLTSWSEVCTLLRLRNPIIQFREVISYTFALRF